jgi:hypothetical protein
VELNWKTVAGMLPQFPRSHEWLTHVPNQYCSSPFQE